MKYRFVAGRLLGAGSCFLFLFWCCVVAAQNAVELATVPRHQLEIRGLKDPEGVLRDLPSLLERATAAKDFKELALLHLARASRREYDPDRSRGTAPHRGGPTKSKGEN